MKELTWSAVILLAGAVAAGCGSSPAAPSTPPPPTLTSLVINAPFTSFPTGFYVNYTATATMSSGTTTDVTSSATWASSNSGIASVDNTGKLSAYARGTTTLTATYQGRTASQTITIVDYFGGKWSGTYVMQTCDQSGVFVTVGWCRGLGGSGSVLPISLDLTQSGDGASSISGTASLGSLAGNISGNVTGDGRLIIGGTYTVTSNGYAFQITFGGWDTHLISPTQMVGGWANSMTAPGAPGNAYTQNQIASLSQTSRTASGARWGFTRSAGTAPSEYRFASMAELFSRLAGR